jgi:hypothetical protein
MPKENEPITQRPNPPEDSVEETREYHGKHREEDEALPGGGGNKGGLNKDSGDGTKGGSRQNIGQPKGNFGKTRGSSRQRS